MASIDADLLLPSIDYVLASPEAVLRRFYAHLERLDPRLRYLLPAALPRYMQFAFYRLHRGRVIQHDGRGMGRLGKRLCSAGFDWSDVDTLMAAWLATLEESLGAAFPAEVREEWARLYGSLRAQATSRPG